MTNKTHNERINLDRTMTVTSLLRYLTSKLIQAEMCDGHCQRSMRPNSDPGFEFDPRELPR